jgi:hypothetical protein
LPGSMDGLKLARAVRDRWPPIELILTWPDQDQAGRPPGARRVPGQTIFYGSAHVCARAPRRPPRTVSKRLGPERSRRPRSGLHQSPTSPCAATASSQPAWPVTAAGVPAP